MTTATFANASGWALVAIALGLLMLAAHALRSRTLMSSRRLLGAGALLGVLAAFGAAIAGLWQAVPAGLAALFALLAARAPGLRRVPAARAVGVLCWLAGFVLVAIAGLALYALPVFALPAPGGAHRVGVFDFEVVDAARAERSSSDPQARRRIAVRAWYPARASGGSAPLRRYRTRPEARVVGATFAEALSLPRFLFRHLSLVETHSQPGASVAPTADGWPLVLYSHGLYGWIDNSTALMEELASHGYVVLSLSHPYESSAVVYPNGDIVRWHPDVARERASPEARRLMPVLATSHDIGKRFDAARAVLELDELRSRSDVWRDDFLSVAAAFRERRAGADAARLAAATNASRVAYAGMSFGGGASVAACEADASCVASVNLDGRDRNAAVFDTTLRAPLVMMYQDGPFPGDLRYNDFLYEPVSAAGATGRVERLIVRGASHWDYTDYTLLARWPAYPWLLPLGVKGPHEGQRMLQLVNDVVRAHLDTHLAQRGSSDFARLLATYPELRRQDLATVRTWAAQRAVPAAADSAAALPAEARPR